MRYLLLILYCFFSLSAIANNKVLAVVHSSAITSQDVLVRGQLLASMSGFTADTKEAKDAFQKQVLNLLIDEKLIYLNASRYQIAVEEDEVNAEIDQIAERASLTKKELLSAISEISPYAQEELRKMIKGNLLWQNYIIIYIKPFINISDQELKAALQNASYAPLYDIDEIAVTSKAFAKELIAKIKSGADFNKLATEFSQVASKNTAGKLGQVLADQLPTDIHKAITQKQMSDIVGPVKNKDLYFIYKINNISEGANPDQMQSLENALKNYKLNVAIRSAITKLRKSNFVEIIANP